MTARLIQAIIGMVAAGGYFGLGALMAISCACIPLPSEIVMLAAGWKAAEGQLSLGWAVFSGTLGCLAGSLMAYWAGYYGGRAFIDRHHRHFLISSRDLRRADGWFDRHGGITVFVTRMIPIVRAFISLPAGVARMPLLPFCVYTLLGSLAWCWGLAYLGYHTRGHWHAIEGWLHRFDVVILAFLVAGFVWWLLRHLTHAREEQVPTPVGKL